MIRRRVVVSGRVQGVFFRDTCRRLARQHGITGWVANRSDGDVEAVFEGDEGDVEAMVDWARHGPRRATVDHCEVTDETLQGEETFSVR